MNRKMDGVRCLYYNHYNACGVLFAPVIHAIETDEVVDVSFAHLQMTLLLMILKFKHNIVKNLKVYFLKVYSIFYINIYPLKYVFCCCSYY